MDGQSDVLKKYRIGYTQGTYDMFHIGHLNFLNHAKEQCDYLVVGVNSDRLVLQDEELFPTVNENERCKIVCNVKVVDKVVIVDTLDVTEVLKNVRFDVVFIENDWSETVCWKNSKNELLKHNIDVVSLNTDISFSTYIAKTRLKIGYTTGTFDMFHVGHLHILQQAKTMCDYLIVGVSTDELVQSYKNKKPIIPFNDRVSIVESTKFADLVIAQENRDKIAAFERLHFDVMFVGDDWKGDALFESVEKYLNAHGAEIVYFPYTQGVSSTMLRKKMGY